MSGVDGRARARVTVFHPGDDSYGLDRVAVRVVEALVTGGYDVSCVLERDNTGTGWLSGSLTRAGVRVTRRPLNNVQRRYATSPRLLLGWVARVLWRLPSMVRAARTTDVVYVNGFTLVAVALAARLASRPVVWHLHEIPPAGRRIGVGVRLLSTRQVCVSHAVADAFGLSGRPSCIVLHNAVEVPGETAEQPAVDGDHPVEIGIVARINQGKGHLVLADAFRRLADAGLPVRLHVVGAPHASDVTTAELLDERLAQVPAHLVVRVGEVASGAAYMQRLHVLAAPSVRPDPFPLSVLEGMAAGLAVVASDTGGHPEAVTDGITGLLCRTGDADDLASRLSTLVADVDLRRQLAAAARREVSERFAPAVFADRVREVVAQARGTG